MGETGMDEERLGQGVRAEWRGKERILMRGLE